MQKQIYLRSKSSILIFDFKTDNLEGRVHMSMINSNPKVIMMVMPFLTPACPPTGICCIKSYVEKRGFKVKGFDSMANIQVRQACYDYFNSLEENIPLYKRGHFFNIALDVLNNQFMAHINYTDIDKYKELVKDIVYKNFYITVEDQLVEILVEKVDIFYRELRNYLIQVIEQEKPDIFSVSVYRGTLAASLFALRLIKENYPHIMTVMGGAIFSQELHVGTPNYELFMKKETCIDKILIGEGEILFLRLLQGQLPDNKKVVTLEDIDVELVDLDELQVPDFSDFNLDSYPLISAYTSRGCIYKCSFCAETIYWRRYRKKSVDKIVDEFCFMKEKYNKNILLLTDCLINPVVTDLSNEMIKRNLNIYWDVYLKVDQFACEPEYPLLWRKGGFYRARLGLESGSQRLLDIMDKKITIDQIRNTLKNLANAGIKTTTYWIAGHPGETEEDFQQTLDLLTELSDYIYEAEADPFRYFYRGQAFGDDWFKEKGNHLLYSEDATDMLLTQTWVLNEEPSRELIYERGCRFKEHCRKLGIPNAYSVSEIYKADQRWKRIHKNAVPPLLDIDNKELIMNEKNHVSQIIEAKTDIGENIDFAF